MRICKNTKEGTSGGKKEVNGGKKFYGQERRETLVKTRLICSLSYVTDLISRNS